MILRFWKALCAARGPAHPAATEGRVLTPQHWILTHLFTTLGSHVCPHTCRDPRARMAGCSPPNPLHRAASKEGPGTSVCPTGIHLQGEHYLPLLKKPSWGFRVGPVPRVWGRGGPSSAPWAACAVCCLSAEHGSAQNPSCTCGAEKHACGDRP